MNPCTDDCRCPGCGSCVAADKLTTARQHIEALLTAVQDARGYYIGDHKLGLAPESNPEVARWSALIVAARKWLEETK